MILHTTRHFGLYILLLITLTIGDGLITNAIVAAGYGTEANSVLSPMIGLAMIAVKALGAAIVAGYLMRFVLERLRIAGLLLTVGLIIYGTLFLWNAGIYYLSESGLL